MGCAGCGVGVSQGRRGLGPNLHAPPPAPSPRQRGASDYGTLAGPAGGFAGGAPAAAPGPPRRPRRAAPPRAGRRGRVLFESMQDEGALPRVFRQSPTPQQVLLITVDPDGEVHASWSVKSCPRNLRPGRPPSAGDGVESDRPGASLTCSCPDSAEQVIRPSFDLIRQGVNTRVPAGYRVHDDAAVAILVAVGLVVPEPPRRDAHPSG